MTEGVLPTYLTKGNPILARMIPLVYHYNLSRSQLVVGYGLLLYIYTYFIGELSSIISNAERIDIFFKSLIGEVQSAVNLVSPKLFGASLFFIFL